MTQFMLGSAWVVGMIVLCWYVSRLAIQALQAEIKERIGKLRDPAEIEKEISEIRGRIDEINKSSIAIRGLYDDHKTRIGSLESKISLLTAFRKPTDKA